MIPTVSPLAKFHPLMPDIMRLRRLYRNPKTGKVSMFKTRKSPYYGIGRHSCGRGVPAKAKAQGKSTIQVAMEWYSKPIATCPNYVIDELGDIYVVTEESLCPPHCGVDGWQREMMLPSPGHPNGEWVHEVSEVGLHLWRKKWPGFMSPQFLFPSKSGNSDYIGVEVIPVNGPIPIFTDEARRSLDTLEIEIGVRNGMNLRKPGSLVFHEDLDPFERWDHYGGFDPGALRTIPWWKPTHG